MVWASAGRATPMPEPASKPRRYGALELIQTVVDPGSWVGWDSPPAEVAAPGSAYAAELAEAAIRSGTDEAIITGEATLKGRRIAVVAGEFRFLAGSIGVVAAERIVLAFERAQREGLPVFAAPSSGGTRMQEGTLAFLGMVKISAAVSAFKEAGLPYVVYLRHPTTGGVFASWGSLGHVTVAEPGALVGFLGPRVFEALYGHPFPEGVQTSENLHEHGLIDAVLPVEGLRDIAHTTLNLLVAPREEHPEVFELPGSRTFTIGGRLENRCPTSPRGSRSPGRAGPSAPASGRCSSSERRTSYRCMGPTRASTTRP